jgi:prepilin-type N-terminal cleavage/methylation domain-containing protein
VSLSDLPADGRGIAGRRGFTLLELMIVTAMLGILAMIAFPIYRGAREKASVAALQRQLRALASAEELHFVEYNSYTDDVEELDYRPAGDVGVELRVTGGRGRRDAGPSGEDGPGNGSSGPPPDGGPPAAGGPGGGSSPAGGGPPGGVPAGEPAGPGADGSPGDGGRRGGAGWSGRLTDPAFGTRCAVVYGDAAPFEPASEHGAIVCDREADAS